MKENRKIFMVQSGVFKFPPNCQIGVHTDCEYIIHWEPLENAKVAFNIFVKQKITFSFGLSTSSVYVSVHTLETNTFDPLTIFPQMNDGNDVITILRNGTILDQYFYK